MARLGRAVPIPPVIVKFKLPDPTPPSGGLFLDQKKLDGLGVGGPFFENPI